MIKTKEEIELMRKTCRLAADTLRYIEPFVKPGISTEELDNLCRQYITGQGAYPSPLQYRGFPKSICTSVNNVVCHGIPNKKTILKDGDIINIDVTTYINGYHGDTSKTFLVGTNIDEEVKTLVNAARLAMLEGINVIKPNATVGDIGAAIQATASLAGFSVVEGYCGHGIGKNFHEEPDILNYGIRGKGAKLLPGMIFTVEPMLNLGGKEVKLLDDGWTVVTKDGSLSAQFEHTVLVTETGYEILTL